LNRVKQFSIHNSQDYIPLIKFSGPIISILGVLSAVSGFVKNTRSVEKNDHDSELERITELLAIIDRSSALITSIELLLLKLGEQLDPDTEMTSDMEQMRPISTVFILQELRGEIQDLHSGLISIYPSVNEELVEDSRVFETRLNSMHSETSEMYISKTSELLVECKDFLQHCEAELLGLAAK